MDYKILNKKKKTIAYLDKNLNYQTKNRTIKGILEKAKKEGLPLGWGKQIKTKDQVMFVDGHKMVKKKHPRFFWLLKEELEEKGFYLEE